MGASHKVIFEVMFSVPRLHVGFFIMVSDAQFNIKSILAESDRTAFELVYAVPNGPNKCTGGSAN